MSWNWRSRSALVILLLPGMAGCGTNTEDPVYPILAVVSPPGSPTILSAVPVEEISLEDETYNIVFDVSYYITNSESDFLGYNLYVSSQSQPSDMNSGGSPYLPLGVEPSFEHRDDPASQASEDLIVQRIDYFSPPPSPVTFTHCNEYSFRLAAVSEEGVESTHGPAVKACATVKPWLCDPDSACFEELPE